MGTPTLPELRVIIREEGLKIVVRNTADPAAVLEKIKAKRAELATNKANGENNSSPAANNTGAGVKKAIKAKNLLSVEAIQKIIDAEGINLRITFKLRKNLARLNEVFVERRKKA